MPVITRGSGMGIAGGSFKGFSVGGVSDIDYTSMDQTIKLKWNDPEDIKIDGVTLAKWAGTVVVRNSDHYPISPDDGEVAVDNKTHGAYAETWFDDTGLENNQKYYYRLFTYTTNGVYNLEAYNVFYASPSDIPENFGDATWDDIVRACNTHAVPETWVIGNKKTLNKTDGGSLEFLLIGKKHDNLSDGSGKAELTFGLNGYINKTETGNPYWPSSYMRRTYLPTVEAAFPETVRQSIKKVTKKSYRSTASQKIETTDDTLWWFSASELGYSGGEDLGKAYPIFTDDNSRKRGTSYWTRNSYRYTQYVDDAGGLNGSDTSGTSDKYGHETVFGFCL